MLLWFGLPFAGEFPLLKYWYAHTHAVLPLYRKNYLIASVISNLFDAIAKINFEMQRMFINSDDFAVVVGLRMLCFFNEWVSTACFALLVLHVEFDCIPGDIKNKIFSCQAITRRNDGKAKPNHQQEREIKQSAERNCRCFIQLCDIKSEISIDN